MAFEKGHKLAKGRPKGAKNKRTSALDACLEVGLDPFKKMAEMAKDDSNPNQPLMLRELCQYIEPKKKAVEVTGTLDVRLQQELEALMKLSEEELLALIPKGK